jgi:hypothetical protein
MKIHIIKMILKYNDFPAILRLQRRDFTIVI